MGNKRKQMRKRGRYKRMVPEFRQRSAKHHGSATCCQCQCLPSLHLWLRLWGSLTCGHTTPFLPPALDTLWEWKAGGPEWKGWRQQGAPLEFPVTEILVGLPCALGVLSEYSQPPNEKSCSTSSSVYGASTVCLRVLVWGLNV